MSGSRPRETGGPFLNFSCRFAARDPKHDVYPWKSRQEGGLPWEGFEKAAWLHHTTGIPVTWMVDSVALEKAGKRLRKFAELYGDEIVLQLEPLAHQPLFEKLGVRQGVFGLRNYSRRDLVCIFRGLRDCAEQTLGREVAIGSGYWLSGDALLAAEEAGLRALWGLCWDQEGIDGATHRGSPWFPYCASPEEFRAPRHDGRGVVLIPWYRTDMGNAFLFGEHAPFSTHSGELVRWCVDYPADFMGAVLAQARNEAAQGPFSYTSFHLECDWIDNSGVFHDEEMSPAAEVWRFQKACVQSAGDMGGFTTCTIRAFLDWFAGCGAWKVPHRVEWEDFFGNFPRLVFSCDLNGLTVQSEAGEVIARQDYSDGTLAKADAGFLDRRGLRARLAGSWRLPPPLARRIESNLGRDESLLNQAAG